VLFLVFVYSLFSLVLPRYFHLSNVGLAILFYGILWELFSTPQHLGLPYFEGRPTLKEHAETTRSTLFPSAIETGLFLNFGLHIEHHFFPNLPWHELKKARILIKEALKEDYKDVIGGIWNSKVRSQSIQKFLGIPQ
jgi:fatty acid desaturase